MITLLARLRRKKSKLIVGLISGTSVDGIDAALVKISGNGTSTRLRLIAYDTYSYPEGVREYVLENSLAGKGSVDVVCSLNILIAQFFADAVKKVARKADVSLREIDLIGSHGQTVHHLPDVKRLFGKHVRSTLQIGDPSSIAQLTGIPTVGDFRTADMAAGGQGAPLAPYLDYVVFRSKQKGRLLLNLGGIANMTMLPKNCSLDEVIAFDTGPSNMVMDALMKRFYGQTFDAGGRVAESGSVLPHVLKWMMKMQYFKKAPPKSTGRELFGARFVSEVLRRSRGKSKQDVIATATELTARTVYGQYTRFVRPKNKIDEVIASGGGVHNKTLMRALRSYFSPIPVLPAEDIGFSSDAKEAILFAVLANETISENPSNVPRATGAQKPVILGKICLA